LTVGAQPDAEVGFGVRVVLTASPQQDGAEHPNRVLHQVRLAQHFKTDSIVTDHVPAVKGVLVAHVGNELGHGHVAAGPSDDRVRLLGEHVGDNLAHALVVSVEAVEEV
jgi:hypothetical protein